MKQKQFATINVLYEDNHLIIVDKKAGDLVHDDITKDKTLSDKIKEYIKAKYEKPGEVFLGVIHRLDRPVSGVIAFARTSKCLVRMNEMLQQKQLHKTYFALTQKKLAAQRGTLVHWIVKSSSQNKVNFYNTKPSLKDAKEAIMEYEIVGENGGYYLWKLNPLTGRPHQIRAQLSAVGCPIINDLKYGAAETDDPHSIYLRSGILAFTHPVQKIEIIAQALSEHERLWGLFDLRKFSIKSQ